MIITTPPLGTSYFVKSHSLDSISSKRRDFFSVSFFMVSLPNALLTGNLKGHVFAAFFSKTSAALNCPRAAIC